MLKNRIKKINNKIDWKIFYPISLMICITILSSIPVVSLPKTPMISSDKLAHFFFYGMIATSIYRLGFFYNKGFKGALIVVLSISLFGASDEIHQYYSGRNCDFYDWLADTLGALVAVFVYAKWDFYRKILEFKISLKKVCKSKDLKKIKE